jgi:hypothetical protein
MEKKLFEDSKPIPQPTLDELEEEKNEIPAYLLLIIRDSEGSIIRTLTQKPSKGIQRFNWDLEYEGTRSQKTDKFNPFAKNRGSVYVLPGTYSVEISLVKNGEVTQLAKPKDFVVKALNNATLPADSRANMVAFQKEVTKLSKAMVGAMQLTEDLNEEVIAMKQTALTLPTAHDKLIPLLSDIEKELKAIELVFNGHTPKASSEELPPADMPLYDRLGAIIYAQINSTSNITSTSKKQFEILSNEFPTVLERIKKIAQEKIVEARKLMDEKDAPYTIGRIPVWN